MSYQFALGRRKRSTATVKLHFNTPWGFQILRSDWTQFPLDQFFGGHEYMKENAMYPFTILGKDLSSKFSAEIKLSGGGLWWQTEALRLAFTRALVELNPEYRLQLKPYGLLKRDPRRKEREKPGLRWARKAPQRSKR